MARTVLITGGSSGIGRALVERFCREDFEVWFTYRSGEERARQLVAALPGRPVRAFAFDQGDRKSHEALFAQLPAAPEIAVLNAGLGSATRAVGAVSGFEGSLGGCTPQSSRGASTQRRC